MSCYSCHNCLKQSESYIKLDFQYQSIPTLEVTRLPLHKISEYQIEEKYNGSDNPGEVDLKSEVNRKSSGKLQQNTALPVQCELLSYT